MPLIGASRDTQRAASIHQAAAKWIASARQRESKRRRLSVSISRRWKTLTLRTLASASSVETISTPKQIWFTVDVLESQPLAMVHFIISSKFTVPDVKFVIATNAMYPLLDRL